jgi:site-specific DNA-methyltransferase (adenine-specific)
MTWTVTKGDCLAVMRKLPDNSIDACITDPPYGTTACKWDSVIPFDPMWTELKRIVKPKAAIVLFASQPFTSALVMSNVKMFKHEWIWRKNAPTGHLNVKLKPLSNHESVVVFGRLTVAYNPQGLTRYAAMHKRGGQSQNYGDYGLENWQEFTGYPRSIIDFRVHRSTAQHPTQKPVDLLRYLVRTYSNQGNTILDFTAGSGTTGVACAIEGRNFIGIEREKEYVAIARKRIAEASRMEVAA